jgi:hypothetical protein
MTIHVPEARTVALSDEERINGRYSDWSLQQALEAMHQDGLVVLKGVVDVDHIKALNERMSADAEKKRDDPNQVYNHLVRCKVPKCLVTQLLTKSKSEFSTETTRHGTQSPVR